MNFTLSKTQKLIIAGVVILPVLLFTFYTWATLSYTYSSGDRAGYVQKFSRKGWLCKTWEGEMAVITTAATMQEKFYFTVKNDAVAARINDTLGKRVALTYKQHVGIPTSCFGDTEYFVTDVKVVE